MNRPAAPVAAPHFTHRQVVKAMNGVSLAILMSALDQTAVVPAVPRIAADLNGFGHLSWIVSAYLLTSTISIPIISKLSDLYGRRALLLPSIVLFTLASVLCAVPHTIWQMVAYRALQGIGGGGIIVMSLTVVADMVPPRERGRYQLYISGMWGIASIVGPTAGGYLTDHLTWGAIFWINVPIGIAALILIGPALKILHIHKRQGVSIDFLGGILLAGAVTAGLLVLSWGGSAYPWVSPPIIGVTIAGLAALALLIAQERRHPDPILPPRLFSNEVALGGFSLSFCNAFCMLGTTFLLPLYFQFLGGTDASASGALLTPFLLAFVAFSYAGGTMARRLGRTKVLFIGSFIAIAIALGLLATIGPATPRILVVLYSTVAGGGIGLVQPCLPMTIQNAVERRDLGVATGCMLLLRIMGGAFGTTLAGGALTARFARRMGIAGEASGMNLEMMRNHAGPAAAAGTTETSIQSALSSGFDLAFLACAVVAVLALLLSLVLHDVELRASHAPLDAAA